MKQLQSALKIQKSEQSTFSSNKSHPKSKSELEKWSLDPDFIDQGLQGTKQKYKQMVCGIIQKRFQCEKYLEQETFKELLVQLAACLPYLSSQLERLARIQETLQEIRESYFGDLKNYIKHFESLLDARIRKLRKRQKKAELVQYERMAGYPSKMKRKNPVSYINQDEKPTLFKLKKKMQEETRKESNSKRSFGTMNSGGSNENESGSGKNISGSDSKSGQANALAVLLANVTPLDDKKKLKETEKQDYNFSSVLSCSVTVRQRNAGSKHFYSSPTQLQKSQLPKQNKETQKQKDEAFIFYRPKPVRKGK